MFNEAFPDPGRIMTCTLQLLEPLVTFASSNPATNAVCAVDESLFYCDRVTL